MKYLALLLFSISSFVYAASFPTYDEIRKVNESLGQISGSRLDEVSKIKSIIAFGNKPKKSIELIYSIDVELKLTKQLQVQMVQLLEEHQRKVKNKTCRHYNSMFKHYNGIKSFDMTFKYFDYAGVNFGNSKFNCYRK